MILPCEIPQLNISDVGRNHIYQVSHMTPVALPQDRAGAGPNKSSSSQFLELG